MMLDILINDLASQMVSDRPNKIPIFPKFSRPQPLLQSRKHAEQFSCTYALYCPNHLTYRMLWRKRYQYMYMILCYFHLIYLKSIIFTYLPYQLFRTFPYLFTNKYLFPIFRAPYQMVCCVIYRMTRPLQSHASCYTISSQGPLWIRETSRLPYNPLGMACIHPRGKPRGILQISSLTWYLPHLRG